MPIYEFYCPDCHTLLSFLSRTVQTDAIPACPHCHTRRLVRRASAFAISKGRSEPADEEFPDLDESKFESAMASLMQEAEGIDEHDPRQAARLMRRFTESTGLPLGEGMEEAIRRMEAGEDPDAVEAELGDLLDDESGGMPGTPRWSRLKRRLTAPTVDETLYEM